MNIDEMSDQEKSVMLARAMGWKVTQHGPSRLEKIRTPYGDHWGDEPLFYDELNMGLAWRVLNWAARQSRIRLSEYSYPYSLADGVDYLFEEDGYWQGRIWALPPADAQRLWLDKILELAIEAGLIPAPPSK